MELFGGIGACTKALKNIGMNVDVVDYVEIDKYAVKSYNAINDTNFEPQDITKWNKNIKVDLIMHGSPCQDFSVAGKQAGGDIGSGTRSSLMYETIRIVGKIRPKYVLWENVKNLLSKKHKHNFDAYIETMKNLGYTSYYQVLNAKDYGIPQNRERVYTISIRRDIPQSFNFPEKEELKLRLKDMLEESVEEKYYLKESTLNNYNREFGSKGKLQEEICDTLQAAMGNGGGNVPIIYEKPLERKGWHRKACEVLNTKGITTCIHTQSNNLLQKIKEEKTCRIRKLTPKECWRLMGFSDEDFEKAQSVPMSNTQLYKQAGNSIVVKVLEKIFLNLLKEN